jgi:hypothetical protein
MHDGQSVAQKVTITGLPCHSFNAIFWPVIVVNVTSGASLEIKGMAKKTSHTANANIGKANKILIVDNPTSLSPALTQKTATHLMIEIWIIPNRPGAGLNKS